MGKGNKTFINWQAEQICKYSVPTEDIVGNWIVAIDRPGQGKKMGTQELCFSDLYVYLSLTIE